MIKPFILISLLALSFCYAEPISAVASLKQTSENEAPAVLDDFIRFTLHTPSYSTAAAMTQSLNDWLGPISAYAVSDTEIRVMAPRDPSARVSFIAAVLEREID